MQLDEAAVLAYSQITFVVVAVMRYCGCSDGVAGNALIISRFVVLQSSG